MAIIFSLIPIWKLMRHCHMYVPPIGALQKPSKLASELQSWPTIGARDVRPPENLSVREPHCAMQLHARGEEILHGDRASGNVSKILLKAFKMD